ncbi:MAG: ABC transporter ATP-binding protein [Pedosphaera sp.]|nr:ABC transporter ATP-binding protein [Pedosphaera sp.]MSU44070.1 ABC transporter ATP-binding protein [Pedosphaera sp.]
MSTAPPIEAVALTKRYNTFTAVNEINFTVARGECVALLGPNGAGKTTTIRMATCFSPVTQGQIRVFGLDVMREPRAAKARMGICPQEDNLDPDFSARKNLLVYARYFGLASHDIAPRADQLLAEMGLTEKANSIISTLSGGMKRRLMLARALINQPDLLVLDEPTTGLDPQARQLIWQRVREIKSRGGTVLLTTHYMEEAQQLADRALLMHQGRIVLEGKPTALIAAEVGREVVELANPAEAVRAFVREQGWPHEATADRLYLYDADGGKIAHAIEARFPEQDRHVRHATLEDVFLRRTGRVLAE